MFIRAKDHTKRCQSCKAAVGAGDNDGFCHKCGEFLTGSRSRWFDTVNTTNSQLGSYASLDLEDEAKEDQND